MNKNLNEKYLKQMKECNNYGTEEGHSQADGLLCGLLEELGYTELVEIYQNLEKWYS